MLLLPKLTGVDFEKVEQSLKEGQAVQDMLTFFYVGYKAVRIRPAFEDIIVIFDVNHDVNRRG